MAHQPTLFPMPMVDESPPAKSLKIRLTHYDWVVINTSAGKDSQAMMDHVCDLAAQACILPRVVAVHGDLSEEEWPGTRELAEEHARHYGIRFEVVKRKQGGILQHVKDRHAKLVSDGKNAAPWPSSTERWCTSDHKRGQVSTLLTRLADETRKGVPPWPSMTNRWCTSHHKGNQVNTLLTRLANEKRAQRGKLPRVRILNCMGMRAAESSKRAKLKPFKLDANNTNGRRIVHTWLPIHSWTQEQVWQRNKQAGTRHHYAYDLGMPRLSCCFCIFAPRAALMLAGIHNRDLLDAYCAIEEATGYTFRMDVSLCEIRDALRRGEQPGQVRTWEM